jgi:hypothetical protein
MGRLLRQTSGGKILESRGGQQSTVLRDYVEQISVNRLAEEQDGRTFRSAVFHVDFARRTLPLKARLARLVEDLRIGRFN